MKVSKETMSYQQARVGPRNLGRAIWKLIQ